ncbi:MAG: HPF/RaiA family ribosome-associated protein [Planctomycetota bacterium]
MQIQINYGDIDGSDAIQTRVHNQLNRELQYLADRVTRVEVHLRDDNAGKAGSNDKRAVMEARPAGAKPITVNHAGEDIYKVIDETAGKLGRAVKKHFDKAAHEAR